jgi:hypothetical protein
MPLQHRVRFSGRLPKLGNTPDECEDHFGVAATRFAIADGASDAIYSQVWAHILTTSYCQSAAVADRGNGIDAWLGECRNAWRRWEAEASARALPWFTRDKLRGGSFATFAGLSFDPPAANPRRSVFANVFADIDAGVDAAVDAVVDSDGETDGVAGETLHLRAGAGAAAETLETCTWSASACGDACLFVVRDDRLAVTFPVAAAAEFDNHPRLIATEPGHAGESLLSLTGAAHAGDRFYLATDALAQWFLRSHGDGGEPWIAFDGVTTVEDFALLVSTFREAGDLRNDDVTLISIETAPAA